MTLGEYVYPLWANILGWLVALAPIVAVPLVMVYKLCTAPEQLSLMEVCICNTGDGRKEGIHFYK